MQKLGERVFGPVGESPEEVAAMVAELRREKQACHSGDHRVILAVDVIEEESVMRVYTLSSARRGEHGPARLRS